MLMVFHSILTVTGLGSRNTVHRCVPPAERRDAGRIRFLPPERPGQAPLPPTISTPENLPDSAWRIAAEEG